MIRASGRYRIRKYSIDDSEYNSCLYDSKWQDNIVTDMFRRELSGDNSIIGNLRLWIGEEELGIDQMMTLIPNVYTVVAPDSVSNSGLITTYTALITPDTSSRTVLSVGLSTTGTLEATWIRGVVAYQNLAQSVNQSPSENLLLDYQLEYII
jgi:hypothetical protein